MQSVAQERAASFIWEEISEILLEKIRFFTQVEGALPRRDGDGDACFQERLGDVLIAPAVS